MKTVWYIARKDLLQAVKDRGSLILLLLVPIVLISVIGLAFGNAFGSSSGPVTINVAVSNQDSGYVGSSVVKALNINSSQLVIKVTTYSTPEQVASAVADANSQFNAGVAIPAGTTDALIADAQHNTPPTNLVKVYTLPNNSDARVTAIQNIVTGVTGGLASAQFASQAAVSQVYNVCNQPGNHCAQNTIDPATIGRIVSNASTTAAQANQVALLTAGQATSVSAFDQFVPGYAIFFALFSINAAAATILQEKEDGTFRRLLIAPIQKYALLGGKLLAQFVLTLTQLAILFVFGYLFFHIHIGNLPALILLLVGASFAATGLGILLVSVVKTRRQLPAVVTLVTLLTSAIGGAWWPLWVEPAWMQNVARIGITAWAMSGLNGIMIFGRGFVDVLPSILGLLGYGVICFIIALRLFRFQEKAA